SPGKQSNMRKSASQSALKCGRTPMADFVAEVFCPSECVRLIQDQASMRNVDSRIHSLRFDCCVFLFYSFSAVTFATWGNSGARATRRHRESALQERMRPR